MGSYHGREGFYEFKPQENQVYTQTGSEMLAMIPSALYRDGAFRKQNNSRPEALIQ